MAMADSKSNGNGQNGHANPVVTGSARIVATAAPTANVEKAELTINSPEALQALQNQEIQQRQDNKVNLLKKALDGMSSLTANYGPTDFVRGAAFNFLLDGPKDIDAECGYPSWLMPQQYNYMYDREAISRRVVDCLPEETWAMDPDIWEDDDPDKETPFEAAWKQMEEQYNLFHFLHRIDVLSGIGQFGIVLIGIDDGKDLREPVDGIFDDGTVDPEQEHKLLYIRVFSQAVVFVKVREIDITSRRYEQPVVYTIQFRDYPNSGVQAGEIISRDIHWTRVIHVADNRKESEVYGVPRMQPVYNRLYDLRKIYSSSGEGYWKGAFPGLAFEVNPEVAAQGIELDVKSIREEMERFQNGLQRYLALTGVTTRSLPPMVVDPAGTVETHLKAIAICMGIPERILWGSEEAVLAGNQDSRAWNKRLGKRQTKYVNPMIIRPFIDRLIGMGILPAPKDGYQIEWPDLNAPTEMDKAQVAAAETQAMAGYVQGGVSQLMAPREYLTHILKYTTQEADAILEASSEFAMDEEEPLSAASQAAQEQEAAEQQHEQALELQGARGENTGPERNSALVENVEYTDIGHDDDKTSSLWAMKNGRVHERPAMEGSGSGFHEEHEQLGPHGRIDHKSKKISIVHSIADTRLVDRAVNHHRGNYPDYRIFSFTYPTTEGGQEIKPERNSAGPVVNTDASIRDKLYDHVDSKMTREPEEGYQCHECIGHAQEAADKMHIGPRVHFYKWDETKWDALGEDLKKNPMASGNRHKAISNLLTDIKDGSVNGHSFGLVGGVGFDPHLKSQGVPDKDITDFNTELAGRYKKLGMHPETAKLEKNSTGAGLEVNADSEWKRINHGDMVDGLETGEKIPNRSSISASFNKYKIKGLHEVPMSAFGRTSPDKLFYAKNDVDHSHQLAAQIEESGKIHPLIVAKDEEGPYVLEGAHRLGALHLLGKKSFPALVVHDLDNAPTENARYGGSEASKKILVNPSKGQLQALFDGVHHELGDYGTQGTVLRGVHSASEGEGSTGHHAWGAAHYYEHEELKRRLPGQAAGFGVTHLYAKKDGGIIARQSQGLRSYEVPGIGNTLRPAKKFEPDYPEANSDTGGEGLEGNADSIGMETNNEEILRNATWEGGWKVEDRDTKPTAHQVLINPDKPTLQAFLGTVHQHNQQEGIEYSPLRIVLRGVSSDDGTRHNWGSSYYHEHHDLKQGDMSLKNHLYASTSGHIAKMGRMGGFEPFNVPGTGSKLDAVKTVTKTTAPGLQWGERTDNAAHPADEVLHNPTKPELQDLFSASHHRLSAISPGGKMAPDDAVLRGVVTRDGESHVWGNAFKHEHEDLKEQSKNSEIQRKGHHAYVSPDGAIWKFGRGLSDRVPVEAKGIGSKLDPPRGRTSLRDRVVGNADPYHTIEHYTAPFKEEIPVDSNTHHAGYFFGNTAIWHHNFHNSHSPDMEHHLFVARNHENKPIGALHLAYPRSGPGDISFAGSNGEQSGVGKNLMLHALHHAEQRGSALTWESTPKSTKLYARAGVPEIGKYQFHAEPEHVKMLLDRAGRPELGEKHYPNSSLKINNEGE